MAINKDRLYQAVALHRQTFTGNNAVTSLPWTYAERVDDILKIKAEVDAHLLKLQPVIDTSAQDAAALKRHDAVEAYLINLKKSNPAQFEVERKMTFEQQAVNAGV